MMPGTLIVISDLHMAAGRHDPFSEDAALVAFLDELGSRARCEPPARLVLLGDTLDFTLVEVDGRRIDPTVAGALARLDRIAAAHAPVFDALRRLAGAGVELHLVPGNHDLELLRPPVMARLRNLMALSDGAVRLHPWVLYLPGLAYLEHGQQHHDINRVPGLLRRAGPEPPLLAGTIYGEYLIAAADAVGAKLPIERTSMRSVAAATRQRPWLLPRAVAPTAHATHALVRSQLAARRAARVPPPAASATDPERHGVTLNLPPAVVADLERVSASTPARAVRRLASPRGDEPYMVGAARDVHRSLGGAHQSVPFYVLAHTHQADDRLLTANPAGPRYLNAGTWSRLAPASEQRRCYVEITREESTATARLAVWDP
ncbi:MAG: hypothetical protein JWO02_2702 [Solirubrobacterales bacterium]|nr:hypothetical protein [Solirubrobacterales bacterium]